MIIKLWKRLIILLPFILITFANANNKLAIENSGRFLVSSHSNNDVAMWDLKYGRLLYSYKTNCDTIFDLATFFDFNDTTKLHAAISCANGSIVLLNKNGQKLYKTRYPKYGRSVTKNNTLKFSIDGELLYSVGKDSIGFVIESNSGNLKNYINDTDFNIPIETEISHSNDFLVTGYRNGVIRVWGKGSKWEDLHPKKTILSSNSNLTDLTLSFKRFAAVIDENNHLILIDYIEGRVLTKKKIITNGYANQVVFNHDGSGLVTAHSNGKLNYWTVLGREIQFLEESPKEIHKGLINSMILYPRDEGALIVTISDDNYIHFTDYNEYNVQYTLFKSTSGWVSYNKKGEYKGTLNLPLITQSRKKTKNPFKNMF